MPQPAAFSNQLLVLVQPTPFSPRGEHHFAVKIPASWSNVEDMVKGFAKAALKHWLKHATRADLANPQIYESVRLTLARNFRSTWKIRQVTGELIY